VAYLESCISLPKESKARQNEFGTTKANEYLRLICHGFLHLCGYDHVNKIDRKGDVFSTGTLLNAFAGTG